MLFRRAPEQVSALDIFKHMLILGLVAVLMLSFSWTGFTASDDSYYVMAGRGWLHDFPYVAEFFGTARELVNIPIAASFGVFGDTEFAAVLPTVLYFLATVGLTYAGLLWVTGPAAAFAAGLLMLTVPLFALKATIPSADLALLFYASLSFWLFWRAAGRPDRAVLLFGSGMAAGAALLSHELALALPIFFTILFLVGFRMGRMPYFLIFFGFLAIIGLDTLYYWIMTGDPLHRFDLMQAGTVLTVDRVSVPPFSFDDSGNFHIWAGIDPLVMMLSKQEFALLFYFAIPAMAWLATRRLDLAEGPAERRVLVLARLLTLLVVVWCLFSAIVLADAKLLPRYFMVPAYGSFVAMMLVAAQLWQARRLTLLSVLGVAFVGCNLVAIHLDNRNPRFAERELVTFLKTTREPVYTDPMTADKAELYLQWARLPMSRLRVTPPEPGALYFYNPKSAGQPNRLMTADDMPQFQPQAHWTKVWMAQEQPRLIVRLLDAVHFGPLLPERLYRKLAEPNPPVTVYRLDQVYADATLGGR
ncbi:ArnT family glycosyltransferase [Govanella unica]|uniref:Glycosyltransferase family 39 protein n=1 Tax=Govanella unica TaxID=2975056 RepID=A0A9X3TWW6_9PROT|nr:glycosyltransferase family 39 protein [Govania unica]MDA5193133.1 glycosyltransferase family 39 protein [Govania unica]